MEALQEENKLLRESILQWQTYAHAADALLRDPALYRQAFMNSFGRDPFVVESPSSIAPAPSVEAVTPMGQYSGTATLTFCECAENHVGMEKIGAISAEGYSEAYVRELFNKLTAAGYRVELLELHRLSGRPEAEEALVLVFRGGVDAMCGEGAADRMLAEHVAIRDYWDKKALMGRGANQGVKNKNARHNLCFADYAQEPSYEEGKGRVVQFGAPAIKETTLLRDRLPAFFGEAAAGMLAESNYYFDLSKTYIGFHGDTERSKVIGARLGAEIPLWYQWFQNSETVGQMLSVTLRHGDVYMMSKKAVGTDWNLRSRLTLRHAAGLEPVLRKAVNQQRNPFVSTQGIARV